MTTKRCPVCRRSFKTIESKSLPFCSERCRSIDLKRWLGEEYSLPSMPNDPDEEPPEALEPPSNE